jgi:Tfp pilus assembly protein PilX
MKKQSGQTLILAILILGVLLIIGFAFAGIISQNITFSGKARQRTVSSDLSEAGIRYAHYQMLNSELGADWRPQFTPLQTDINGNTKEGGHRFSTSWRS